MPRIGPARPTEGARLAVPMPDNVVDPSDVARLAAVIALVPGWDGRARVVGALSGGITNRNHVVDVDGERFVVRLPGADTELLEIDRECELIAATRAAATRVRAGGARDSSTGVS